jgi:hypothetical protein
MTINLFGFRVKDPLDNWARRHGGAVRYRVLGEHRSEDLVWGDVFVFERMAGAYALHLIQVLKQYGKRVVFDPICEIHVQRTNLMTSLTRYVMKKRPVKPVDLVNKIFIRTKNQLDCDVNQPQPSSDKVAQEWS